VPQSFFSFLSSRTDFLLSSLLPRRPSASLLSPFSPTSPSHSCSSFSHAFHLYLPAPSPSTYPLSSPALPPPQRSDENMKAKPDPAVLGKMERILKVKLRGNNIGASLLQGPKKK
jgi:hypothetical protein